MLSSQLWPTKNRFWLRNTDADDDANDDDNW